MSLTVSNFELSNLTDLDNADVQQVLEQLTTQLQELNPSLDLKRGVFKDIVAYYHAVLETAIRTNLERYQSARSLQQINANAVAADSTVVDEVLSNWGVTRKTGTRAIGSVTIEISQARSVTIPANFTFSVNGLTYVATQTFTSRTSEGQISNPVTDRLLVQLSNGNWAFTIEVEAEDVGSKYKLNAGDTLNPDRTVVSFVASYATSTFNDGLDAETNEQLIADLQLGLAAKALSNRTNMRSYLRSIPALNLVTNQSIVGYGDAEMLRDQHTIFPVSYGGRVDWYIRGQETLQRLAVTVTATCVSIAGSTSTWQFALNKNASPGFYEVTKVRRQLDANLNSGFEIILDSRSNDLTGDGFIPDITTIAEGAYTAFQTAIIQFVDTVTLVSGLAVGQTALYTCELIGTPLIQEIQTLVSSRDVRSYAADALVKAPVPCFVQVTLTLNKTTGTMIDADMIDKIKLAVIGVVNRTDFVGRLDGSYIIEAVHGLITDNISVTQLDLLGRIRRPDGTLQYLRDPDSIVIPEQPVKMVTAKTVQFFAEVADVSVNVASTIPTAK
jgi:hypothetical protein